MILDDHIAALLTKFGGLKFDTASPDERQRLLAGHLEVITSFAACLGGTYEQARCEHGPDIVVDGWLRGPFEASPVRDTGHFQFCIGRGTLASNDGRLAAHIRDLWLPERFQNLGYGRELVKAFFPLWRRLGVESAHAYAVPERSIRAFKRWGFTPQYENATGKPDPNGFPTFVHTLISAAEPSSGS
jgi:GNAT superfamily N-acetyltransferase